MSISNRRILVASMLGAALAMAAPAFAQHNGGGHGGGGGAHLGGGGGGAHVGGGHFFGGGGHAGGGGVSHASVGHFGGATGQLGAHYGAAHYGGPAHAYGGGAVTRGYSGGRAAYGYPGGFSHHGYSTGAYWRGGYWRGGYWPRVYYGFDYLWFLPVLPLAYSTYWYSNVPYYYANDVYYTWNPDYDGYTATDPPPVTEAPADGSAVPPGAGDAASGQIFMYPKSGQSQEQQSTDKRECQQWAASQVGAGSSGNDYRRAMMACIEGRGYSAN